MVTRGGKTSSAQWLWLEAGRLRHGGESGDAGTVSSVRTLPGTPTRTEPNLGTNVCLKYFNQSRNVPKNFISRLEF